MTAASNERLEASVLRFAVTIIIIGQEADDFDSNEEAMVLLYRASV
jgi:hypothetical protein